MKICYTKLLVLFASIACSSLWHANAATFDPSTVTNNSTITLPSGDVDLVGPDQISGKSNFTIQGAADGSTRLIVPRGNWPTFRNGLHLLNCSNATLSNFKIDFYPIPFTQGYITAKSGRDVTVQITIGFPDFAELFAVPNTDGSSVSFNLFNPQTGYWKVGTNDIYTTQYPTYTSGSTIVFTLNSTSDANSCAVGDAVVLKNNKRSGKNAIRLKSSSDITVTNVTVQSAPDVALYGVYLKGAIIYDGVKLERGPAIGGIPRRLSGNADGFQHTDSLSGVAIVNGDIGWQADDGVYIHGRTFAVVNPSSPYYTDVSSAIYMDAAVRGEQAAYGPLLASASHDFIFMKAITFETDQRTQVDAATVLTTSANSSTNVAAYNALKNLHPDLGVAENFTLIKLKVASSPTITNTPFGYFPGTTGPGFEISDSYFHDQRGSGLLISASSTSINPGIISNNRFERIKRRAISMGPRVAAGWAQNIIVKENICRNIGFGTDAYGTNSYNPGAITVFADNGLSYSGYTYPNSNLNVQIYDNVIHSNTVDALHINAADNITGSGNYVSYHNTSGSATVGSGYGLTQTLATGVTLQNSINSSMLVTDLDPYYGKASGSVPNPPLLQYEFSSQDDLPGVIDSSGNGLDGAASNTVSPQPGVSAPTNQLYYAFNGVSSSIDAGAPAILDFQGDFTLMAWIKITAQTATNPRAIVMHENPVGGDGSELSFGVNTAGKLTINNIQGATTYTFSGPSALTANTWVHVAVRCQGNVYKFYINGAQTGGDGTNATTPVAGAPDLSGKWTIGSEQQASGSFFVGCLDDVRVYNYAMALASINAISANASLSRP